MLKCYLRVSAPSQSPQRLRFFTTKKTLKDHRKITRQILSARQIHKGIPFFVALLIVKKVIFFNRIAFAKASATAQRPQRRRGGPQRNYIINVACYAHLQSSGSLNSSLPFVPGIFLAQQLIKSSRSSSLARWTLDLAPE